MSAASGLIKVLKKGATAPAKAPPFYSAVDEVAQGLSRNKGTGKEFLREIEKTKGVKSAEIKDRNLDKILNTDQKMTKDELVKVLEDNPPRQITEETPGGISKSMIDDKIYEMIEAETKAELGPRPKLGYEREDWLEDFDRLIEEKSYRKDDYYQEAKEALMEEGNIGDAAYDRPDLKLPGGENYREILLKLPTFDPNKEKQLMELEANLRRMNPVNFPPGYLDSMKDEVAKLKAEKASFGQEYKSSHWTQPNVLAHMRVQDRVGPNGEKVLHVEEIQSDWHQAGRSKGYKSDVTTKINDEDYQRGLQLQRQDINGEPLTQAERQEMQDIQNRHIASLSAIKVPDAPFKKNWHELAMKRLINYAAENGYDKIAITPGKLQIDRYEEALRKNLDALEYEPYIDDSGKQLYEVSGFKGKNEVFKEDAVTPEKLQELLGKDTAKKISEGFGDSLAEERPLRPNWKRIQSSDISVGGEGMKGFYDQMLPAYLNKFGEKYGAKVKPTSFGKDDWIVRDEHGDILAEGFMDELGAQRYAADHPSATIKNESGLGNLHTFDITPQMREEVLTKGQPLYQQIGIPAATGAAGAGMLEDEPVFNRSEKVNITDNPDTMFLELNDQHYGVGGAAKKAIKAIKGTQKVLPAAEREENLQKFLGNSRIRERLYHATPKNFKQFKPGGDDPTLSGPAIWLTPDATKQPAAHNIGSRSQEFREGTNVMPVYAQSRSPLLLDDKLSIEWAREVFADGSREFPDLLAPKTIEELKKGGYDSIIHADPYGNRGGEQEIIMFEPNKIKSAIGNRGTYDITSPDINEAQGGLATLKRK